MWVRVDTEGSDENMFKDIEQKEYEGEVEVQ